VCLKFLKFNVSIIILLAFHINEKIHYKCYKLILLSLTLTDCCVHIAVARFETNVNKEETRDESRDDGGRDVSQTDKTVGELRDVTLERQCCALELGVMQMIIVESVSDFDASNHHTQQKHFHTSFIPQNNCVFICPIAIP